MGIKTFLSKRIIIYPVFSIATYLCLKYFFPTEEDKAERERLKNFPKIIQDPVNVDPKNFLDLRGGFFKPKNFLAKIFENDSKYVLGAVTALCGLAVADRYRQVLAELLKTANPVFAALPVPLARRLLEGFAAIDPKTILSILKEGLLSNELTLEEKLNLLKKSLHALIIAASTDRMRRSLLITAFIVVLGTTLASGPLLGGALLVFQDLFTRLGFKRGTIEFIISIYNDYNAPFPEELVNLGQEIGVL